MNTNSSMENIMNDNLAVHQNPKDSLTIILLQVLLLPFIIISGFQSESMRLLIKTYQLMLIKSQHKFSKGHDFFQIVTSQCCFIDKSNFIKQVIDSKEQVIQINRPSGWGKKLNLSMLNYFFSIELDQDKKLANQQQKRVLFEGGEFQITENNKQRPKKIKLARLSISEDQLWSQKYSAYLGKYPVIYLDLNLFCFTGLKEFLPKFSKKLSELFEDFQVLIESLKKYKNTINKCSSQQDLEKGLSFLVEILHKRYKQKVIVLIDGYDTTYTYLLQKQLSTTDHTQRKSIMQERKNLVNFMTQMLKSVYKNNDKLEKVVIVGVLDILPNISQLHFIKRCGVLDKQFASSFGFREDEVKTLVNKIVDPSADSDKKLLVQNISSWYKGYINPCSSEKQLFNPLSVIMYLAQCALYNKVAQFQCFYRSSFTKSIIIKLISVNKTNIERLFQLNEITPTTLAINESFILGNQYFWGIYEIHWSRLFLNFGCLTGTVQQNNFDALFPNKQMALIFSNYIKFDQQAKENSYFYTQMGIENSNILIRHMERYFQKVRRSLVSQNKNLFINLFAGHYLSQGEKTHSVSIQLESGFGKIDSLFVPIHHKSTSIIIHQYKYLRDNNKDPQNLFNALWSIYQNNYLQQPLIIATKYPWIKYIITRPIAIYAPDTSQDIQLEIENVYHSIDEARKISQFFARSEVINILNLNHVKRNPCHEALLRKFDIKDNLFQLLEQIPIILEGETHKAQTMQCKNTDEQIATSILNEIQEKKQNQMEEED